LLGVARAVPPLDKIYPQIVQLLEGERTANAMKGNVLIVDDSLTVRMDLADAFEAVGLRPLLCSTIREARETFTVETIDLVILDVMLPDGDGVEFLKEIRTRLATPDLPILMLSGEAEVKDRIRGLQTGADDYVGKPYDASYVVARGRELVRLRQNQSAR
jgi:two-component system NtrC family sensor kinase